MPYCYSCGKEMNDGERFCSNCGASIAGQMMVPASQPYAQPYAQPMNAMQMQENNRKDALAEMTKLIDHFGQKQAQYDEYDICIENLNILSNPRAPLRGNFGISGTPFIIIGAIVMGLGIELVALTSLGGSVGATGALFVLLGSGSLAAGIVLKVMRNKKIKAYRENMLLQCQNRYNELSNELSNHYRAYGYCPMSPELTNPKTLSKLRDIIWQGRADSIKESINILRMDEHYTEMEIQAARTAQAAASAARGANTAAVFSAANFFLK